MNLVRLDQQIGSTGNYMASSTDACDANLVCINAVFAAIVQTMEYRIDKVLLTSGTLKLWCQPVVYIDDNTVQINASNSHLRLRFLCSAQGSTSTMSIEVYRRSCCLQLLRLVNEYIDTGSISNLDSVFCDIDLLEVAVIQLLVLFHHVFHDSSLLSSLVTDVLGGILQHLNLLIKRHRGDLLHHLE